MAQLCYKLYMQSQYPLEFEGVLPSGVIIYQPHKEKASEGLLYDLNAWQILTYPPSGLRQKELTLADLTSLCNKWRTMIEKSSNHANNETDDPPESSFIDLFTSGRRRYRVKGCRLYDKGGLTRQGRGYFMFTLERIHRNSLNLTRIFRESGLSKREQDVVYQLLEDKCNKEIADALGLSLNTVKVYLKNLMRKINVTSRAGIVSFLLLKPSDKRQ